MIDTHAHIYMVDFDDDRDQVIQRALRKRINTILLPNINIDSIQPMLKTEMTYPGICYSMIGLHPCYVKSDFLETLETIYSWFSQHKFIAIGEIGMDFYRKNYYKLEQEEAFIIQLNWAKQMNLPVVIHARNSIKKILKLLSKEQDGSLTGVFHCFCGDIKEAMEINFLGFHIGLGGISTFKNSGMEKVIPYLDLNYLILETDCPYLSPVPYRGKRNEPAHLQLIVNHIAKIRKMASLEIEMLTTNNAKTLFQI
ncbi:deoxyribonuclease YabD [Candidatus Photodesmus katoptron]|uniref:Hydrolase, TatD n=1 Tax=Candidatus Photodesmus katoptron Akat1 TaxID=1236703 RepID=S3EIK1_9GAMM|nr:TatD family hydrolase [Candidatus Photodesmus katoptron]EPE38018.1 hydrolase, TatD [Candidatus Photodesmus katoptron Akat1]KEY90756.1 deoxyribonuclease YabD [Candidatus Photodesmus katoptron]